MWSIYHTGTVTFTEPQLGWKKQISSALKSYNVVFQPIITEISAKEEVIRQYADAATMGRVRRMFIHSFLSVFLALLPPYSFHRQNLTQASSRNTSCPPGYHIRVEWLVDTSLPSIILYHRDAHWTE